MNISRRDGKSSFLKKILYFEIYSHPDLVNTEINNGGDVELAALLSKQVRELLTVKGFKLSNYNQLI